VHELIEPGKKQADATNPRLTISKKFGKYVCVCVVCVYLCCVCVYVYVRAHLRVRVGESVNLKMGLIVH